MRDAYNPDGTITASSQARSADVTDAGLPKGPSARPASGICKVNRAGQSPFQSACPHNLCRLSRRRVRRQCFEAGDHIEEFVVYAALTQLVERPL